jgi:hypothetical protein
MFLVLLFGSLCSLSYKWKKHEKSQCKLLYKKSLETGNIWLYIWDHWMSVLSFSISQMLMFNLKWCFMTHCEIHFLNLWLREQETKIQTILLLFIWLWVFWIVFVSLRVCFETELCPKAHSEFEIGLKLTNLLPLLLRLQICATMLCCRN